MQGYWWQKIKKQQQIINYDNIFSKKNKILILIQNADKIKSYNKIKTRILISHFRNNNTLLKTSNKNKFNNYAKELKKKFDGNFLISHINKSAFHFSINKWRKKKQFVANHMMVNTTNNIIHTKICNATDRPCFHHYFPQNEQTKWDIPINIFTRYRLDESQTQFILVLKGNIIESWDQKETIMLKWCSSKKISTNKKD